MTSIVSTAEAIGTTLVPNGRCWMEISRAGPVARRRPSPGIRLFCQQPAQAAWPPTGPREGSALARSGGRSALCRQPPAQCESARADASGASHLAPDASPAAPVLGACGCWWGQCAQSQLAVGARLPHSGQSVFGSAGPSVGQEPPGVGQRSASAGTASRLGHRGAHRLCAASTACRSALPQTQWTMGGRRADLLVERPADLAVDRVLPPSRQSCARGAARAGGLG